MEILTAPPWPAAGVTVSRDTPDRLADAIILRLERPALRFAEGRAGRARVEHAHSFEVWLPAMAELTRSVADGASA